MPQSAEKIVSFLDKLLIKYKEADSETREIIRESVAYTMGYVIAHIQNLKLEEGEKRIADFLISSAESYESGVKDGGQRKLDTIIESLIQQNHFIYSILDTFDEL